MKKNFILISIFFIVFSFIGCSNEIPEPDYHVAVPQVKITRDATETEAAHLLEVFDDFISACQEYNKGGETAGTASILKGFSAFFRNGGSLILEVDEDSKENKHDSSVMVHVGTDEAVMSMTGSSTVYTFNGEKTDNAEQLFNQSFEQFYALLPVFTTEMKTEVVHEDFSAEILSVKKPEEENLDAEILGTDLWCSFTYKGERHIVRYNGASALEPEGVLIIDGLRVSEELIEKNYFNKYLMINILSDFLSH